MKLNYLFLITFLILLAGCNNKQPDLSKVTLKKVQPGVYVHVSYGKFGEKVYPANGLVYFNGDKAILVDTPWTEEQTEYLCNEISRKFKKKVDLVILTHYHTDNLGGIGYLKKMGIQTVCTIMTKKLSDEKLGISLDYAGIIGDNWSYPVKDKILEVYYPGPGHTMDNIVVWFEKEKLLFGGCMVKSLASKGKGNTADADLEKWPGSVENLINRYGNAAVVIPGHGEWGNKDLLMHTLEIVKK